MPPRPANDCSDLGQVRVEIDRVDNALVEAIVYGFYPRALADKRLRDATRTWLAEHPEAADALRRLVTEAVDPIDRALRAQARDAEDA